MTNETSKIKLSKGKLDNLKKLADSDGIISALAIDQRGSLSKMIKNGLKNEASEKEITQKIENFKVAVSEELTPYCSSILLDPEYGMPAAKNRYVNSGLLLAYEKTGYDTDKPGRFPDLLEEYSAYKLKQMGANAIKLLIYYDVDEKIAEYEKEKIVVKERKLAFLERLGAECLANDIPLFVEPLFYDSTEKLSPLEFAKAKPNKVIEMMKELSDKKYHIDVLKVEVPVDMNYVEGFAQNEVAYSKEQALEYFKLQSEATNLPFIFLSAGVSADLFKKTILFAKEAGSKFNGVLCGRATWKDGVSIFAQHGDEAARQWLKSQGKENINSLNEILKSSATSIFERVENS